MLLAKPSKVLHQPFTHDKSPQIFFYPQKSLGLTLCGSRKYPYPTTEGIGNSGGVGRSKAPENPEERGFKRIPYFPEGQLRFIPM